MGGKSHGDSPDPLSAKIERVVVENVKLLAVVIPIDEFHIDEAFVFATATVIPLSRATFDDILNVAASQASAEKIQLLRDEFREGG